MNMEEGSIRIFPKMERVKEENAVHILWLTTAGVIEGRYQLANIRSERRQSECLMKFYWLGYRV
jgi:hypothetical protein